MPTQGEVLAAVVENCLHVALLGERDEEGHLLPESHEEIDALLSLLNDPDAMKELQAEEESEEEAEEEPKRERMSWLHYVTRGGNSAWLDQTTGKRLYQDSPPGGAEGAKREEAAGPLGTEDLQTFWELAVEWARILESGFKGDDAKLRDAHKKAAESYRELHDDYGQGAAAVIGAAMTAASAEDKGSATTAALAILLLGVYGRRSVARETGTRPTPQAVVKVVKDVRQAAGEDFPDPPEDRCGNVLEPLLDEAPTGGPEKPVMMSHERTPDVTAEAVTAGEELAAQFRKKLVAAVKKKRQSGELTGRAYGILHEWQVALNSLLYESFLAADLDGRLSLASKLPAFPSVEEAEETLRAYIPRLQKLQLGEVRLFAQVLPPAYVARLAEMEPSLAPHLVAGERPLLPKLRFSAVEAAVESLHERGLLAGQELSLARNDAQRRAYAVAGQEGIDAMNTVRELLAEEIVEGPDEERFAARFEAELGKSPLGPARVKNTFRTGVMEAYARGMERVLEDPIVGAGFPYVETVPIYDDRLSKMCRICAKSGIQGTGIYRRDDPSWARIKNPRHRQCRCGTIYHSVDQAAIKGIKEAREWRDSGKEPIVKAWVPMPDIDLSQLLH